MKGLKDGCELRDDRCYRALPIPFPDVPLTEDERLTLLAAIYDTYAEVNARIAPWSTIAEVTQSKADKEMAARWWVLCQERVPELRKHWKTHEADVGAFLADVEGPVGVLLYLADRHPALCTLDDFEQSMKPRLSRAIANRAVKALIEADYAHRPKGPRKGATVTWPVAFA